MTLSLPFSATQGANGPLFEVNATGGGCMGVWGGGYGTDSYGDSSTGVYGVSDVGVGVQGNSDSGFGVQAQSGTGTAIHAVQTGDPDTLPDAVLAETSSNNAAAVAAHNNGKGSGVWAFSQNGTAIYGKSNGDIDAMLVETSSNGHAAVAAHNYGIGSGVWAFSQNGTAIWATNEAGGATADADALIARTVSPGHAAVSAANDSAQSPTVPSGYAVWAKSNNTAIYGQGTPAGYFNGDVLVTGDLVLVNSSSGDIAEDFDIEDDPANAEPGTVLVIRPSGKLSACSKPYDTRVAGVVSGAGDLRPAIVLQRLQQRSDRSPLALVGKALCKVDATFGGVAAGDLLTTSVTPGHAMKVENRAKAVGAILGKALHPLDTGRGLVPVLVSLR